MITRINQNVHKYIVDYHKDMNMDKLNFLGIGPKIGVITLPWLAVTIFLSVKFEDSFNYIKGGSGVLLFFGLVLGITGLIIYLLTAPALMKGLKETKLVMTGAYRICCHPLYASIILFIIPGTSFVMNSWLVLTTSIVGFVLFKIFIKSEYAEMEKFFGDEYRKYRAETPEFFPFPIKKWFRTR
jgi:protein-S-isoprenylcysteine O-methyltransferase Ste14